MVQIYSALKGFIFILENKVKYFKPKQDQNLNVTRALVEGPSPHEQGFLGLSPATREPRQHSQKKN